MLDHERKLLKGARTQYQKEVSTKTDLEHLLRDTVEQVRTEKNKRKVGPINKYMITGPTVGDDEGDLN